MRRVIGTVVALLGTAAAVVAGPATVASADVVARDCTAGSVKVPRCVELQYDASNHRYRAWASIRDNQSDNSNYDVDARDTLVSGVGNEEIGYHAGSDTLGSGWRSCGSRRVNVTYAAVFAWRNAVTGATDSQTRGGAGWVC